MQKNKNRYVVLLSLLSMGLLAPQAWAANDAKQMVARGEYVARIGGCNDCHTDGYLMKDGNVPTSEWLKGSGFGWRGPWGTTYPPNLRLFVKNLTEDQWVKEAKTLKRRPPMPFFNLNAMHDDDLRALYQFIKSLGEPGNQAPAYIPPDKEPPMPYASFPAPPPAK